jgi:hypothetical protein
VDAVSHYEQFFHVSWSSLVYSNSKGIHNAIQQDKSSTQSERMSPACGSTPDWGGRTKSNDSLPPLRWFFL